MATIHETHVHRHDDERVDPQLRPPAYAPRRRRWPGVLAAAVIGAGIAALAVSSLYDERTIGERIDTTVQATGQKVAEVDVTGRLDDAGITSAVKTSLAADPALSALKIDVDTHEGVVTLTGPAPDEKARERAAVLAAAPEGVKSVDNRLVVAAQ